MTAMEYPQATAEELFQKQIMLAGGLKQWNHFPAIVNAANRWVVSPNIDAMFSFTIVDARKGFTATLSDVSDRFLSLHVQVKNHTNVE